MALESILFGVLAGIVLTAAVSLALKLWVPVNAATRAIIWSAALLALAVLPPLYFFSHQPIVKQATPVVAPRRIPAVLVPTAPSVPMPPLAASLAPTAPKPFQIALPEQSSEIVAACYLAIVMVLLFRLIVSYLRLRLLRYRTQPAPAELASRLQYWLTRCPTHRRVELRISTSARSPLAIGFLRPLIVIPADLVLELSRQEYDDLGVHELAHIRRYDDWTNLAQRILQAFLFFHPAAHYIGRKLNLEREIACDDWVVAAHEGKSYARCLAKVVELRRFHGGGLLLSSGAFFGKRQVVKRVESLLDKTRNSATTTSSITVIFSVLALAAIALQVAHLPAVVAFTQDEVGATTSSRWSDGSRDLRIKIRGDVTFSDEQSVASLSPDGFLIIDEAKGWSHRRIEARSGSGDSIQTKYFIDGHEKPLDGVGRAWAASQYLYALRELGIDSDARVRRILSRRGAMGVMEEVDLIHSDHVKCDYLNHLLEQATLTPRDLQRVTDCVRKVSSDNDKAEFLIAHEQDLATGEARTGYFSAVNTIHSDNDRRRVLTHILETSNHDPETTRLVTLSAKAISSDNDKAEVLLAIPPATSGDARCGLLNAARTIQSDNDKARVLQDSGYVESAPCRDAWFAVANLIQSDNDRSNVLQKLLSNPNLDEETYHGVAQSAKSMNSDNDKANVLVLLSTRYVSAPLFEAADTIQSDNDRARVLKSALERKPPGQETLLAAIQSAAGLNDDNEKANVLLEVAARSNDAKVRAALQKACDTLHSDTDYRRVASTLFNGSVSPESSK